MTTAIADEFETHRPRLFGLAYRLLGSADEAEDTVQDAYLRFSGADRDVIEYPGPGSPRSSPTSASPV